MTSSVGLDTYIFFFLCDAILGFHPRDFCLDDGCYPPRWQAFFFSGKPAPYCQKHDIDWVPTLELAKKNYRAK